MPKIYRALAYNGSPPLRIETDEDRTYCLVEIPIHPEMLPTASSPEVTDEALDEALEKLTPPFLGKTPRFWERPFYWWPDLESNQGHKDFQAPTTFINPLFYQQFYR